MESGRHKPGELANQLEILGWLNDRGVPWDGATEGDVHAAMTVLDDFRRRRASYGRISIEQAEAWVWQGDKRGQAWAAFHLGTWREAVAVWLAGHRSKGERYFAGILRNKQRDARSAVA